MMDYRTRMAPDQPKTFLKAGCSAALLLCVSIYFCCSMYGQEEHGPGLPEGEGKELTTFVCSQCHGLRETLNLRDGQKGWEEVVDRMVLYGAQLTPGEAAAVTRYLATQLGPGLAENSAPASPNAHGTRSQPITLPAGAGRELVGVRCAQCHGLEKAVSLRRSKEEWVSITNNMVQRGMKATPEETRTIIAYLQAYFSVDTPGASLTRAAFTPPVEGRHHVEPLQVEPAATAGSVRKGKDVFTQKCFQCHSVQPDQVRLGPSLYGEMRKPHPKKTEMQVRTILRDGKGTMPAFKDMLSKEDSDNLLAYLHSL